MQPALARDGAHVSLHAWQAEERRWSLVGSMEVPSSEFVWARCGPDGTSPAVVIAVDLGDGKPVELVAQLSAEGTLENEYVAASAFIAYHYEALNPGQHLEEVAKMVRAALDPVFETVQCLKRAMQEQN